MFHKHFCAGLLTLVGVVAGATGCVGVDGESYPEQWADDESSYEQSPGVSPDDSIGSVDAVGSPTLQPRYPNCGIIACPVGTECQFDSDAEARCIAPGAETCAEVDCGSFYHCEMTVSGAAACIPGLGTPTQ